MEASRHRMVAAGFCGASPQPTRCKPPGEEPIGLGRAVEIEASGLVFSAQRQEKGIKFGIEVPTVLAKLFPEYAT
jgi:hypothetical protein